MSFNEINKLRKSGQLQQALLLANNSLAKDADNIWNKRALAWVYFDFLKAYCNADDVEKFTDYLLKLKALDLSEDEDILFDSLTWKLGSLIFSLNKVDDRGNKYLKNSAIEQIFDTIQDFPFIKPSKGYSFLLKAFHKYYKSRKRYLEFMDWWNFENLMDEDFKSGLFNGKKLVPLAEQVHIAYAKILLDQDISPTEDMNKSEMSDAERKIRSFIVRVDKLLSVYPNYQYIPFYKAKLMLALGERDDGFKVFLPYARTNKNESRVWIAMVDFFSDNPDIQFSCYCKALSLNTDEKYLLQVRVDFSRLLEERKMYSEAKTEINTMMETRRSRGFMISLDLVFLEFPEWYQQAELKKDNQDLYEQHLAKAEEILYKDIEEEVVVVEFVNKNKNILNFVKNEEKSGFFKYPKSVQTPKIGDVIKVRFDGDGHDNFYKILTLENANLEEETTCEAIKKFDGNLSINPETSHGFVDDIYVHPKTIEKNQLTNGQSIQGKAILSYNQAKNEWGWKVSTIKS